MENKGQQLIEQLKKFGEENKISQAKLAKQIGINEGALSAWINGKYQGVNEEIEEKVEKFLVMQKKKSQDKIHDFGFTRTSVAEKVFIAAQNCQIDSLIGVCYGDPGLGKTTALKQYAKKSSGVVVIECEAKMSTMRLLEKIYKSLNIGNEKFWNPSDIIDKIQPKLNDSGWLLIIDEAEHLNVDTFEALRRIHDFSECTFGILFTGTKKLYSNLMNLKGDYAYLVNRIGFRMVLEDLKKTDVELIVQNAVPDIGDELVEEIYSKTNQNARVLTNTLKGALKLSKQYNKALDSEMIAVSRRMLIV